jgi:hypothetical protein
MTSVGKLRAVTLGLAGVAAILGQESQAQPAANERQQPAGFFALPVEVDFDSGADNGDATILRFAPLYRVRLQENWSLINIDLLTLADTPGGIPGRPGNPAPEPGMRQTGLGDLVHGSFLTPPTSDRITYGFGAMLSVPIASDEILGSGKWSAGPAFRFVYREGPWNLGFFGGNLWSFAGNGSRADVNQLTIRGAFRRDLSKNWYLVSAPVITANWKAASGQKWVVPLGGGIGRQLGPDSMPWALSVQAYCNVIKPDGAPDWVLRLAVVAAFPLGK